MKRMLAACVLPLLLLVIAPSGAHADAAVVQDSCVTVPGVPPFNVWTYFTVVNFSLPAPVCGIQLIPEPQPPNPGCIMVETRSPAGWVSNLVPMGGAAVGGVPVGGAVWTAVNSVDCIAAGDSQGEFAFLLDPAFCCYVAQFFDAAGALLLQQEECFTCQKVPAEQETWGHIKQIYE